MPDGFGYVLVTYLLAGGTIGAWFWMIAVKLRRQARAKAAGTLVVRERRDA